MNQSIAWKIFFLATVGTKPGLWHWLLYFNRFYFSQCELLTAAISIQAKDSIDPTLDSVYTPAQRGFYFIDREYI